MPSCMEVSTHSPLPVFSRNCKADRIPIRANSGAGSIADRGPAARRRMVRKAGDAIDAAGGLNDRIIRPPVAAGSVLAKA